MKYPFAYVAHCYDYDDEKNYLQRGIGFAESFANAAGIVEKHYGKELIAIKHLELYEDNNVITLPKDTYNDVVDCLESEEFFVANCDTWGNELDENKIL